MRTKPNGVFGLIASKKVGLLAAVLVYATMVGTAAAQIQQVVVKGDLAPEPSASYRNFRQPVATDVALARTVFEAKVRGATFRGAGIFIEDPLLLGSTVAKAGDLVPSGIGQYQRFSQPAANILGDIVWQASVRGGLGGIFRNSGTAVALLGDALPPPLNGAMQTFGNPALSDNGDVVFHVTIQDPSTLAGIVVDEALLRCSGGDGDCTPTGTGLLEILVPKGAPIPDRAGRFLCGMANAVGISTYGIAFTGSTQLDCNDALEVPVTGVFRMAFGGAIETLAMQGEQAEPFLQVGGTVYSTFGGQPGIEDNGIVAFDAQINGLASTAAIYQCDTVLCPPNPAQAVVMQGDQDASLNRLSRFRDVDISNAGDISFYTSVTDGPGRGLAIYFYRTGSGALERVVGKGDPLPGAMIPTTFGQVRRPTMSPGGRIAFRAKVKRQIGGGQLGVFLFE